MTVAPSNSPNSRVVRLLFFSPSRQARQEDSAWEGEDQPPETPTLPCASAALREALFSALRLGAFARGNVSRQGFSEDLAQRRGGAEKIKRGGRPPFYRDGRRRLRCLDYARHDRRPEQLTQFPGCPPSVFLAKSPSTPRRFSMGRGRPTTQNSYSSLRLRDSARGSLLRFAAWRLCEKKCFSPRIFGGLAQRRRED